ncbi:MAG: outer membrane beta-barrel protein [Gemmatimonadetes bacterium]|jgi:opacity protein-like surface antigen|nr:outer membrane beta-barrel protein [Gemmatimonadota bacterium]MBT5059907.1 outer membrane beta-barrel protein [Gemmatimonadota bacterium]MBT5142032.1 outer membrane beta-barrel protein [Gemmatimonadota bacterium]MBT5589678.1 outer membrane beta-barrel protein [Gemmatimonadota bacterium]MBT5963937.1 outer membrane beta-barrel protein [Gemmatimonadota bacterium]
MRLIDSRGWLAILFAAIALTLPQAAQADVSTFIGSVSFDEEADLDNSLGVGLRWGKSSGIFGGETSLMIARPERTSAGESVTAIFYEGRILVNIPVGQVMPFVGVGFGAITTTSADVPSDSDAAAAEALEAIADLQTNSAFSYGAGVRYALSDRMDARFDVRQYQVLSVQSLVQGQIEAETGIELPASVKEKTVQHSELSVGVVIRF